MSWMHKLYETYEQCAGREPEGTEPLPPISHTRQLAQIEIVLDGSGEFQRAAVIADKAERDTLIPCTEESAGRTGSKPTHHPLCDKLQYVAADFVARGGEVTSGFAGDPFAPHREYLKSLRQWAASGHGHSKVKAVLSYVEGGTVMEDLIREQVLPTDETGNVLKSWSGAKDSAPTIFKAIQNTQCPGDSLVRWRVESEGNDSRLWKDEALIASWTAYYSEMESTQGLCMGTGREGALAKQHPARLRHGGDKAKLVSWNDSTGFTYLGRFLSAGEAIAVGFEVTQKAHNALRWLLERQAYRNDTQAIVAWTVPGKPLPNWFDDAAHLLGVEPASDSEAVADTSQAFARRLARAVAGYGSRLDASDEVIVLGLDSATPGRMSITFYRELKASEFLDRIERWHREFAWPQNFGKEYRFIGCASPKDIAEAAYGKRVDEKLRRSTVERLLPCIVDGRAAPADLEASAVRRAANRVGFENWWEWEKCLGIACSLFKGNRIERRYEMALEEGRRSRDYLYGRLLAVAENIEGYALYAAGEKRETTAARYMQRFADRPASTWRGIELALRPYMQRLRNGEKTGGFLHVREKLLDEIINLFERPEAFTSDERLSGEFLLGYHCQRQTMQAGNRKDSEGNAEEGQEKQ